MFLGGSGAEAFCVFLRGSGAEAFCVFLRGSGAEAFCVFLGGSGVEALMFLGGSGVGGFRAFLMFLRVKDLVSSGVEGFRAFLMFLRVNDFVSSGVEAFCVFLGGSGVEAFRAFLMFLRVKDFVSSGVEAFCVFLGGSGVEALMFLRGSGVEAFCVFLGVNDFVSGAALLFSEFDSSVTGILRFSCRFVLFPEALRPRANLLKNPRFGGGCVSSALTNVFVFSEAARSRANLLKTPRFEGCVSRALTNVFVFSEACFGVFVFPEACFGVFVFPEACFGVFVFPEAARSRANLLKKPRFGVLTGSGLRNAASSRMACARTSLKFAALSSCFTYCLFLIIERCFNALIFDTVDGLFCFNRRTSSIDVAFLIFSITLGSLYARMTSFLNACKVAFFVASALC
jgi:hypothetical protein